MALPHLDLTPTAMNEKPMSTSSDKPAGLVCRILGSPLVRLLVLGFVLLMMMGLNTDVMTSYAGYPFRPVLESLVTLPGGGAASLAASAACPLLIE